MDKKRVKLYYKSLIAAMEKAVQSKFTNKNAIYQSIFYGVQAVAHDFKPVNFEDLDGAFRFAEGIMQLISMVTPREFVIIFPINKTYDGERFETKDYFYTNRMIQEHGWDEKITEPFNFLWDYENWETRIFIINLMSLLSGIRRAQGQPGIAEEWAAKNNITMYRMYFGDHGKKYVVDKNGRSIPVNKKRPRHLKLVSTNENHFL